VVELVRDGVVTGARKNIDRGKVVTAGLFANPDDPYREGAMRYIADHPEQFEFRPIGRVANVAAVAAVENMVAVNMVLAVDLLGQAVINYLDRTPIAGIGGNFDFTVGAHYAPGGRSVYCILSTAQHGTVSRIVPLVPRRPYSVVSMPGYMVDYLVSEHGVVNLEGMGTRDRAEAIISIAHPDFRADLRRAARRMGQI
jgi:acyl-CoA hydrolase